MEWKLENNKLKDNQGRTLAKFSDEAVAMLIIQRLNECESLKQQNKEIKSMLMMQIDSSSESLDKVSQIVNKNFQEQEEMQKEFSAMINEQNKQLGEVYYVIYTTGNHYNQECPEYLQLVNDGRMIQGNIYDASKFVVKGSAEKELQATSEIFKDKKFDIIPIDRRIFGSKPRWVEGL